MEMKEVIYRRKSTRQFEMMPLDESILGDIKSFSKTIKPLDNQIKTELIVMSENSVKGVFSVKAPHYILLFSEIKSGYELNTGFILQQMDLYLQSIGLGSCWLGMAKPLKNFDTNLEFIIMLAFGNTKENPYRELFGFIRKPLSEVSDISDERLEPARLAPSATNSQPWYFISDVENVHAYCVKHGPVKAKFYERLNKIDLGIALAHLYVSYSGFKFLVSDNPKQINNYYYIGSINL